MDSVEIFYKLLGIATVVYCKGKGYLRGKVFFYTQRRIAGREKKTTSERNYKTWLLYTIRDCPHGPAKFSSTNALGPIAL